MKRLFATGAPDALVKARRQIRPVETWPLTSEHPLPGANAYGCEGQINETDETRVLSVFQEWGCDAVAIDAHSSPQDVTKAITARAVASRYTDGRPHQG